MMTCRVCQSRLLDRVIDRPAPGLTSLAAIVDAPARVWLCAQCGHLSGEAFSAPRYYEQTYDTVRGEEDDLLDFAPARGGAPVYRVQEQCARLFDFLNVPETGRLLDFGCGHGVLMRRFRERRPRWETRGHEMSDRYAGAFISTGSLPDGPFDLITAFYVLEHVESPGDVLAPLAARLAPGGTIFLAVPDPLANPIDALAVDHLSHFTPASLEYLLAAAGLRMTVISPSAMTGTLLCAAKRDAQASADDVVSEPESAAALLGAYWAEADASLAALRADASLRPGSMAIYGAGVYGAYLFLNADLPAGVLASFLDRNPRKHGTLFHGLPVRGPHEMDDRVETVLIGVRPDLARGVAVHPDLAERRTFVLPAWRAACIA